VVVRAQTMVLLRHGQSAANAADSFSGWLDVPLTDRGRQEAARAGELLAEHGLLPDTVHTSVLIRSIETAQIVLTTLNRPWPPTHRSWRLNERHYGALQGRPRAAVRREVGDEIFARWRRSYAAAPPPLPAEDPSNPRTDPYYAAVSADQLPLTESLADVRARVLPYWHDVLIPELRAGRAPLVVAHGNTLRALRMHLDQLGAEQIRSVNVPTGVSLRYDLDERWRPVVPGGSYLDAAAAARRIAEELAQGAGGAINPA